jgi:hypothetical protein
MVASVLVFAVLASGCTGSFNLTRKVYNFHRSQSDKWTDELLFLVVSLTPIYGLATFGDAIIFNSIEFWTGDNPIDMSANPSKEVTAANGQDRLKMSYNPKTDQVQVASTGNKGVIFERSNTAITAKNEQGEVLFSSAQNERGGVTIHDGSGKLVKEYSVDQIAMLKEEYLSKQ